MFSTHLVLIATNQTIVEHLAAHDMKDREEATRDEMFAFLSVQVRAFSFSCHPFHLLYELSFIGRPFQGNVAYARAWDAE